MLINYKDKALLYKHMIACKKIHHERDRKRFIMIRNVSRNWQLTEIRLRSLHIEHYTTRLYMSYS